MNHDTEICGFLDVKYFGDKCKNQRTKKRALTQWKIWRRHWCSARKLGPGLGIKIELDCGIGSNSAAGAGGNTTANRDKSNKSVVIPSDAVISRTRSRSKQFAFGIFPANERKPIFYLAGISETESQRWMANIRNLLKPRKHRFVPGAYSVSMVDNAHARESGLSGMHGDLIASVTGVFVKDSHSGEIVQNFEWPEFDQFHLISAGRPEDVKCICVIHTTKQFRGGVGELHMFCLEATKLLRELAARGRGPKERYLDRRPLSLSEGDLRFADALNSVEQMSRDRLASNGFPSMNLLESDPRLFFVNSEECLLRKTTRARMYCNDSGGVTVPGNPSKFPENLYQPEPASVPNTSNQSQGRMSAISTGSGIYEEISEDAAVNGTAVSAHFTQEEESEPPPLPPRYRLATGSSNTIKRDHHSDETDRLTSAWDIPLSTDSSASVDEKSIDTCNYVPMSPRLKDITMQQLRPQLAMQENDYVIMR